MVELISTKRLIFAIMMGTLSLVMQLTIPGILILGAKIEFADLPALLGAVISGPVGGMICGFLYGSVSPLYLSALPSMTFIFALLGYLSDNMKIKGGKALSIVLSRIIVGPILVAILGKLIYFPSFTLINLWIITLSFAFPGALLTIPLYYLVENRIPGFLILLKKNVIPVNNQ